LDGRPFGACSGLEKLSGGSLETDSIEVSAIDNFGNHDLSPAVFNWRVITATGATGGLIDLISDVNLKSNVEGSLSPPLDNMDGILSERTPTTTVRGAGA
jgi:hypothetical protein